MTGRSARGDEIHLVRECRKSAVNFSSAKKNAVAQQCGCAISGYAGRVIKRAHVAAVRYAEVNARERAAGHRRWGDLIAFRDYEDRYRGWGRRRLLGAVVPGFRQTLLKEALAVALLMGLRPILAEVCGDVIVAEEKERLDDKAALCAERKAQYNEKGNRMSG